MLRIFLLKILTVNYPVESNPLITTSLFFLASVSSIRREKIRCYKKWVTTVGEHTNYLRYVNHRSVAPKRLKITKEFQRLTLKQKSLQMNICSPSCRRKTCSIHKTDGIKSTNTSSTACQGHRSA